MNKGMPGAVSGNMPEGRRSPDHSGTKMPIGMDGALSGSMPNGRRKADHSGDQVKAWKRDGDR